VTAEERAADVLRLEVPMQGADDRRILRSALLSARATELSELQRRAGRHTLGYGSDSARESMDDDVRRLRRRIELLDALIAALTNPAGG
jgi:hypothetical protein